MDWTSNGRDSGGRGRGAPGRGGASRDADDPDVVFLDETAVRAEVASPIYRAGRWDKPLERDGPSRPAYLGLARAFVEVGVEVYEHTPVRGVTRTPRAGLSRTAERHPRRRALATNVFPSLLEADPAVTVPVYDYVLMTEPLSADRLSAIGWCNRQGVTDLANQFHYYRLSADDRILFGGYDAVYYAGRTVRPEYEEREETFERLAATSSRRSRSWRASGSRTAGRGDRHLQPLLLVLTIVHGGRVAYPRGSPASASGRRASRPTSCWTCSPASRLNAPGSRMVRNRPLPVPAGAADVARRQDHHRGDGPRRPEPGPARTVAETDGRGRHGV